MLAKGKMSADVMGGKILGIGQPPREDAYELMVKQDDGTVAPVIVPKIVGASPNFHPGSYYCVLVQDDQPTNTEFLLSPAQAKAMVKLPEVEPPPPPGPPEEDAKKQPPQHRGPEPVHGRR